MTASDTTAHSLSVVFSGTTNNEQKTPAAAAKFRRTNCFHGFIRLAANDSWRNQAFTLTISAQDGMARKVPSSLHPEILSGIEDLPSTKRWSCSHVRKSSEFCGQRPAISLVASPLCNCPLTHLSCLRSIRPKPQPRCRKATLYRRP